MLLAVKELHRQPVDLLVKLLTHAVGNSLRDMRHNKAHQQRQQRADGVNDDQFDQNSGQRVIVDAAGTLNLGNQSVEQLIGRAAENLRALNRQHRTDNGEDRHKQQRDLIHAHIGKQLADRSLEILGLLARHTGPPGQCCFLVRSSSRLLCRKLRKRDLPVFLAVFHQFFMRAHSGDPAAVKHDDPVTH